jgi:hypothetical protein
MRISASCFSVRIFLLLFVELMTKSCSVHRHSSLNSAGVSIWAVSDGDKINQEELASTLKQKNAVWDGQKIKVYGARNEIIAFQIIIENHTQYDQNIRVTLPQLSHIKETTSLLYQQPNSNFTLSLNRYIQLFHLNYLTVQSNTNASWIIDSRFNSNKLSTPAHIPVQIVPENRQHFDHKNKEAEWLSVKSLRNQSVWIEIYVGKNFSAGKYYGNVSVKEEEKERKIPLELEVFDFTLPDNNPLKVMVYYEPSQIERYHGRYLHEAYHQFAHRHRIELVRAYTISDLENNKEVFDGTLYTKEHGYEGPGEGIGNVIIPASFYGPQEFYKIREKAWQYSNRWMDILFKHFPKSQTFLYMPDEPASSQFSFIKRIAQNIHSNKGIGRKLPILITHPYENALKDFIDIWVVGSDSYNRKRSIEEKRRGVDTWLYNGKRPYSGAVLIDTPAADTRAIIWSCFKHSIGTYFFWHSMHWEHNLQKQERISVQQPHIRGSREGEKRSLLEVNEHFRPTDNNGDGADERLRQRLQNIWRDPITFDNRGQPGKPLKDQGFANGDGVLIYPGQDRIHPEEDRGIEGPIGSIQLANFRRGIQDILYLQLAQSSGHGKAVEEALNQAVPVVLSDLRSSNGSKNKTGFIGFAEKGDVYEAIRYRLGKLIEKNAYH